MEKNSVVVLSGASRISIVDFCGGAKYGASRVLMLECSIKLLMSALSAEIYMYLEKCSNKNNEK